jgi:hypothetical protein
MRARCKFCGFVRAKNTTRQFEHVQQCNEFLNSNEGRVAVSEGLLSMQPPFDADATASGGRGDIFKGRAPNPTFNRFAGKQRQSGGGPNVTPSRLGPPPKPTPSLVNHLLTKNREAIDQATQLQFLSHAGCGTLSSAALQQWLAQQGHMSRALCTYIGSLIGKIRLTDTENPSNDTSWRALDLLVSAVNNAKRELEFLRTTHFKYNLQTEPESPKPATKGFVDLFANVSSSGISMGPSAWPSFALAPEASSPPVAGSFSSPIPVTSGITCFQSQIACLKLVSQLFSSVRPLPVV